MRWGCGQEETLPRLINLGRIRPDRPKALATPLEYVLRVKLIIKFFVGSVNRAASSMGWAAGPLHGGCCSPSSNTTAISCTCPSCGCPWASVRKKLFSHGSRARPQTAAPPATPADVVIPSWVLSMTLNCCTTHHTSSCCSSIMGPEQDLKLLHHPPPQLML